MQFLDNHIDTVRNYFVDTLAKVYGLDEARQMFRISLAYLLQIEFNQTLPARTTNIRFSESEVLKILAIVKRLKLEEPIQYVLGEAWFMDLDLKVSPAVLIPRQETEMLVSIANRWLKLNTWATNIIDLGTGSGCIPIAIAKNISNRNVFAIDYSFEALEIAKYNALKHNQSIQFEHCDMLTQEPFPGKFFDAIISNPPYIAEQEKAVMEGNVLMHEPELALFVPNENPLLFYKRINEIAKKRLRKNGLILLEINEFYGEETKTIFNSTFFKDVELVHDLNGKNRFLKAVKK